MERGPGFIIEQRLYSPGRAIKAMACAVQVFVRGLEICESAVKDIEARRQARGERRGQRANWNAEIWLGPSGISGFPPGRVDWMVLAVATEHVCTFNQSQAARLTPAVAR